MAVLGQEPEHERGRFRVEAFIFPLLPPQVDHPALEADRFVVFASGLDLGAPGEDRLPLQMMAELLTGGLGSPELQRPLASVGRLILAGNAISEHTRDREALSRAKYLTKRTVAGSVEAVRALDDLLAQLAVSGVGRRGVVDRRFTLSLSRLRVAWRWT